MAERYPRIASFRDAETFRAYLSRLQLEIPVDDRVLPAPDSPLARPLSIAGRVAGNRWCVQPMEGWDGTPDGRPSERTLRRWQRFGESGAKIVWGGEATAVRHDGRANPNQLVIAPQTVGALARLRETLVEAHRRRHGRTDDLLIGLQLTHSGRFCRPNAHDRLEPRIAYHHPILDRRVGIDPDDHRPVMTDAEVDDLIGDFARAARLAVEAGFDFVDIKHCHGYLLHEFLGACNRPGRYGGDFEGRTRLLREVIGAVRREAPELLIAVRLSAFDMVPFRKGPDGVGEPEPHRHLLPYRYGFGVDPDDPTRISLEEADALLGLMARLGVAAVNVTGGSPYYTPHIQRPALFPPSDGYLPPEEPLAGVARHVQAVRALKAAHPEMVLVGSGYTYLQEFLPNVAQAVVRQGWADAVGIGRMVLAYPWLPSDVLEGRQPDRRRICRTFSDCTTAPRNGLPSGCYPLDGHYRESPERARLEEAKRALRTGS
ncbi:oxidoreductase [Geochorda subterranea]|uniref:NADH:flavin oxidoreductase/NADH oxidase N-terminal domain-containing protein n=1 Tax=Geochorda subterranea TaxID=3109564 RepID=A0ABZ1BNR5_9FIRM|nr:hypothetical protein [Limnochorda sp. LNt]WRP14442.1 hypothetical protein VLY81_13625 [Limnochorda sp. LNt]